MKYLILGLLALLSASSPSYAKDYRYNEKAVIRLECGDKLGTAVKISDDEYITAAHVVTSGECRIGGVLVTELRVAAGQDFATFKGPSSPDKIKVRCSGYQDGETYVGIGYAFGEFETTSEPMIASSLDTRGMRAFIGETIPGMSGGPVLDRDGRVVGIVNMRWPARSIALKDTVICD